ncbi:MAG: aspartoacylase [Pleurocapsa sp.]
MLNKVSQVTVVGGIHGNELLGVYLIKKFVKFPQLINYQSFSITTLLANPQAIELGRRYIDIDLNRCFALEDLHDPQLQKYEQKLAKNIYRQIHDSATDFLLDLHTSTASMGITLLLSNKIAFNLNLAAYLSKINPLVKVVYAPGDRDRLRNLCPLGFTIEIGAIPHGVLDAIWFNQTEKLIFEILNYLERFNRQQALNCPETLTLYSDLQTVDFPRDERGEITAMVHPDLQGKDYAPLHSGKPLFLKFDGSQVNYLGSDTVYPIFINESAYWEKRIAMYLTRKQIVNCQLQQIM